MLEKPDPEELARQMFPDEREKLPASRPCCWTPRKARQPLRWRFGCTAQGPQRVGLYPRQHCLLSWATAFQFGWGFEAAKESPPVWVYSWCSRRWLWPASLLFSPRLFG